MSHNKFKIVSNIQMGTLSYWLQNEQMVWTPVSRFSDLSKRKYTYTSIKESASLILNTVNYIYNPGNRGIDIFYEGSETDYSILCKIIEDQFPDEHITCTHQNMKIAVVGKRGVGKTTLIEALGEKQGFHYQMIQKPKYKFYGETSGIYEWYELDGIDFREENVLNVGKTVDELAKQGLTALLYCVNSVRVEETEKQLIEITQKYHPEILILGVYTNAVSREDIASAGKISDILGIKVIPVIAKEQKTRSGMVEAFGLEEVVNALFRG